MFWKIRPIIYAYNSIQEKSAHDSTHYKKTDEPIPDEVDAEPSRASNKSDLDKPLDEDEDDEIDRNEESESDVSST